MTKKMGRPTDNPKPFMLRVRLDTGTHNKLNLLANKSKDTMSSVVRKLINKEFDICFKGGTLDE